MCIVVIVLCVFILCVLLYCVGIAVFFFFTLDAGMLARSQSSEGPVTGHLDTGFFFFGFAVPKSKC